MKRLAILGILLLASFGVLAVEQIGDERGELIFPGSINVKDYGAVGDGVHDDTAAIQAASQAMAKHSSALRLSARCRNIGNLGVGEGPIREIVFPQGTYRITDTVFFKRDIMLRGAGKVIIRQEHPEKDAFYMFDAFRCHVLNFTFVGGCIQCRVWTNNNDSAHVNVRNCQFIDSTGPAFECYSRNFRNPDGSRKNVGPYKVVEEGGAEKLLPDERYEKAEDFYNSSQIDIDGCTWENCMHAVAMSSDGAVIRNCRAVSNPDMIGGLFQIENRCHVTGVEALIKRNNNLWQCVFETGSGMRFMLDNSTFSTDNGRGVCTMQCTTTPSKYLPTSVILRDLNTESAGCPENAVLYFNGEAIPNIISIGGIKDSGKGKVKVIASKKKFTRADFDVMRHNKNLPAEQQFSVAIGKNSDNVIDKLPVGLRVFQQEYPKVRNEKPLPKIRLFSGKIFKAEDYGIDLKDLSKRTYGSSHDDTAAVKAIFADAAKEPGSIVVFPGGCIHLKETIELPSDVCVIGAGLCVFANREDEGKDLFSVKDAKSVKFSNIMFIRGRRAVTISANSPADVVFDNCFIYDTADAAIYAQYGESLDSYGQPLKVYLNDMTAGVTKLYKGNAVCWMDGLWLSTLPDVPHEQPLDSSVAIENYGFLQCNDFLGVPMILHRYPMGEERSKHPHVSDYRWADNHGSAHFLAPRFGGEWSGICGVYHYGKGYTCVDGGWSWNTSSATTWPCEVLADAPDADVTVANVIFTITDRKLGNMWRKPGEKPQFMENRPFLNCVYMH